MVNQHFTCSNVVEQTCETNSSILCNLPLNFIDYVPLSVVTAAATRPACLKFALWATSVPAAHMHEAPS